MITVTRYHDISCGHRVTGHKGKCQFLHGHNYRIHFTIAAPHTNELGMVLDFTAIKTRLCQWLEDNFDHKFLLWEHDPLLQQLRAIANDSIVVVPFNPTAEGIAQFLVDEVAPEALADTGCVLISCKVDETRKCSAEYILE